MGSTEFRSLKFEVHYTRVFGFDSTLHIFGLLGVSLPNLIFELPSTYQKNHKGNSNLIFMLHDMNFFKCSILAKKHNLIRGDI